MRGIPSITLRPRRMTETACWICARSTRLEQRNVELTETLEESQADLAAAREANRELTRTLNQRGEQVSRTAL